MLKFKKPQKTFEIGEVKIGGQPGENPTVLIGSIFYHGHKIVLDENKGLIDKKNAEKLILLQEEISEKTKTPCMLDVVGSTKIAMEKFISFVAETTEIPILIDSADFEVKNAGLRFAGDIGLEERIIYNSLTLESKQGEFEALLGSRVKSAILLAYKTGVMTGKARADAIKALLPRAEEAGVTKPLIDTFVMDVPSLLPASAAIIAIKRELGYPSGCGAHNAISTWAGFDKRMGAQAVEPCTASVDIAPAVLGADFILYGPIEDCEYVFPSMYAINVSKKYLLRMGEQIEL